MRFTKVEIPDLVEALQRQGFAYAGPGWQGWMKFTGDLKLSASTHACELVVSPDLDEIPRIWLNDLPMKRRELRPHLSASGYLCYLALDSVMFDSLDPIGQTLACITRAEQVLEDILAGKMTEDLAEEFPIHWGGAFCCVDVQNPKSGHQEAYAVGDGSFAVLTDDKTRTAVKLLVSGRPTKLDTPVPAVRVKTTARPLPQQQDWPPDTVGRLLSWQSSLDPGCRRKVEEQLLALYKKAGKEGQGRHAIVIIQAPELQYGFDLDFQSVSHPAVYRETLYRTPIRRLRVFRIDDAYMAQRNTPDGKTLAGLRIALVGCGTIGGYLAEMLVKAGAGTDAGLLTLVDNQLLAPQNIGRHRLGFDSFLKNKAQALREELMWSAPGATLRAIASDVKLADLGELDLLIDATGEQALTDWLTWKYASQVPMLAAWIEGDGLAVRALLKAQAEHACPRCVSRPPLKDQYRVFEEPVETLLRGHGCEGLYVPFPATVSVQAAALAMEMVQAWIDGKHSPSFRTRVIDNSRPVHCGDCTPARFEGCPACST